VTSPSKAPKTLADRFDLLTSTLKPWAPIFAESVLASEETRENQKACLQAAWGETLPSEALRTLHQTATALIQGEHVPCPPSLAPLQELLGQLEPPCRFPKAHSPLTSASRPLLDRRGMTPKKQHEVHSVLRFLEELNPPPGSFLDLCCGAGHLSHALAQTFSDRTDSVSVTGIDHDSDLITRARARRQGALSPTFEIRSFPFHATDPLGSPSKAETWSLGLHTCGSLSLEHLALHPRGFEVLNFGCCYERLPLETGTSLSVHARTRGFPWTRQALFLATRGGLHRSFEAFEFQHQVTLLRHAIDALLREEGRAEEARSVGDAPASTYRRGFPHYVRSRLGSGAPWSDAALEEFFRSRLPTLELQWWLSFLQNLLARPLECLLLVDRALWLSEVSPSSRVEILEFFDPALSPRNLGIVARRKPL
jgi:SAM-dependent methyltransferase